jgi:hypothetical protein
MNMPYIIQVTPHPCNIFKIDEHGIEVETGYIGIESSSGKGVPIRVKKPADRGSGELIKALEQLDMERLASEPISSTGHGSLKACAYTIYEIWGQEIDEPVENEEYLILPHDRELPIIVEIPHGLKLEQIKEALGLLKTKLLSESG